MKKYILPLILMTLFSINKSISQNLNFTTKYLYVEYGGAGIQEYKFEFNDGWLTKTDLSNYQHDNYPSYNDDAFYDKNGNYSMFFTPTQYAKINPLDFLKKCRDDTRAYRITFDKKDGQVLYVKELRKWYNSEREKYYITELGKQLFKDKLP